MKIAFVLPVMFFMTNLLAESPAEKMQDRAKTSHSTAKRANSPSQKKAAQQKVICEAVAKDGAKAILKAESHSVYWLDGRGFEPNETMMYVCRSESEVLSSPLTADENGELPLIGILPAVIGKSGGECHVKLLRK